AVARPELDLRAVGRARSGDVDAFVARLPDHRDEPVAHVDEAPGLRAGAIAGDDLNFRSVSRAVPGHVDAFVAVRIDEARPTPTEVFDAESLGPGAIAPPLLNLSAVRGPGARNVHARARMGEGSEVVIAAGESFVSALRLVTFVRARAAASHRQQENRQGD